MTHVVNTNKLLADGWIDHTQATEIAKRSREAMVALSVNTVLFAGILAATFGLIFWLADATAVAVAGAIFIAIGMAVLLKGTDTYRMLGNASAIVGAGMLCGGAGIEIVSKYREFAEALLLIGGAGIAGLAAWVFTKGKDVLRFAAGSVCLMGVALHLTGFALAFEEALGWTKAAALGYATLLIAGAGLVVNVRLVTALAIAPFAQMIDTGTAYFSAAYVFYSPESTLTILQMAALVAVCIFVTTRFSDRIGRHAGILAIMGAVVANLAFLVGSLWGDQVGYSLFEGPVRGDMSWEEYDVARQTFRDSFFTISEHVYSVAWAIVLAVTAYWAAISNRRGLFNAAMTFGGIHAYTQTMETLWDEPLAWAICGLTAIPVAWGMWRLNQYLAERANAPA